MLDETIKTGIISGNGRSDDDSSAGHGVCCQPGVSRSAEEWARLQDNKIEYDEIADLIHGIQCDRPEKCH